MPIKNSPPNFRNLEELENLKRFLQQNSSGNTGTSINNKNNKIGELKKQPDFAKNLNVNKNNISNEENLNLNENNKNFDFENEENFYEEFDNEDNFRLPFEEEIEEKNDVNETDKKDEEENRVKEISLDLSKNNKHTKEKNEIGDLFNVKSKNKNYQNNPLLKYRDPGISIKLPSLGYFYEGEEVVEFEENLEVNVYPMTVRDEVYVRTPDYLLNGSAIESIIKSCVPSVKNVKKLLINDVAAILLGIKWASDSNIVNYNASCPKCGALNNFDIDLSTLFDNMAFLKKEYFIDMGDLLVFVKPYTYDLMVKNSIVSFEESKVVQTIVSDENLSEQEKINLAQKSLEKLQNMAFFSTLESIVKIFVKNTNETITNKEFIRDWLNSLKLKNYNKIKNLIQEINECGVPTSVEIACVKCENKFSVDVRFDPANFLG